MAKPDSGNTYTLTNWGTGYNLNQYAGYTANGTNVIQWTADSSDTGEHWKYTNDRLFPKNASSDPKDSRYVCLDRYITKGSTFNNADIWQANDDNQQILKFTETGDGKDLYTITLLNARENGNVLYLTASSTPTGASNQASGKAPGANGNVYWSSARTANQNYQKWRFSYISGGGSDPGGDEGGKGNGTITKGIRPSTLDYSSYPYSASFNRFHKDYVNKYGNKPNKYPAQCTWHCYGRAKEVLGKTIAFEGEGGLCGGAWWTRVTNCPQNQTARANSIAVWTGGTEDSGHVAYVEKVVGDTIYISEANYASNYNVLDATDGIVRTPTETTIAAHCGSGFTFQGYLYL